MKSQVWAIGLMLMVTALAWMGGPGDAAPATQGGGTDVTFTTDADFDQGALVNVNHDAPDGDQLQLNRETQPFPFVNVAASGRGTVVRIHADTGEVVGEYRTAPEGRGLDPSRTTVDLFGNVWTGNRGENGLIGGVPHGSVVKIGLVVGGLRVDAGAAPDPEGDYLAPPFAYNTCVDHDDDGLIKTSRGLGDIRPWPDAADTMGGTDGIVEDADDECILIYQRLAIDEESMVRHISVDADNNVWVGEAFTGEPTFYLLDGNTGAVLASPDPEATRCGGYGGLVDGNGILWSASRGPLLRYNPATGAGTCIDVRDSYGMGIDINGFIWISMWDPNEIAKLSPAGVVQPGFPEATGGEDSNRGVAITPADNHVWLANTAADTVQRLDNDGKALKTITVGCGPTGVAVDVNGKVWVTNQCADNCMRIDPYGGDDGLGAVDLTVDLDPGASPYNYSDMTGMVAIGTTSRQGTWSVMKDTLGSGSEPAFIAWNTEPQGSEPPGTEIVVEARTAGTEAGLGGAAFQVVSNAAPFALGGRFIEVRVTLKRTVEGASPVLSDLRIHVEVPTPTPAPTATPVPTATPAVTGPGAGMQAAVYLLVTVAVVAIVALAVILARRARRRS